MHITIQHEIRGSRMVVRPKGVMWFATVPQIERIVRTELATHHEIDTVEFDLSGIGRLDYTVHLTEILENGPGASNRSGPDR